MAEPAAGLNLQDLLQKLGTTFNRPNGTWEQGEGSVADVGGILSHDDAAFAEIHDKLHFVAHENSLWASSIKRFVGHGRDIGSRKTEAAFEILVPVATPKPPTQRLILLWMWPTIFGTANDLQAYMGRADAPCCGLLEQPPVATPPTVKRPSDGLDFEPMFQTMLDKNNTQLISVHFVCQWSGHPLGFDMQRAVQVLKSVRKVLARSSTPDEYEVSETVELPCLVIGSSYSSSCARLLPYHYPQFFHAGFVSAFPPSMLRGKDDQTMHDCLVRLEGIALGGNGWSANSQFNFSHWAGQRATLVSPQAVHSFYADSFLTREASASKYQRPLIFFLGNGDAVTHGTDFLKAAHELAVTLTPASSGAGGVYSPFGQFTTSSGGPKHSWMIPPERCHSVEPFEPYLPYFLPNGQPSAAPHKIIEAMRFAIAECLAEFALNRTVTTPPWTLTPPSPAVVQTNPHQHFLARGVYVDQGSALGTKPHLLTEVPAVTVPSTLTNCGVILGRADSLVIDPSLGILTGSAEGIVSRVQPLSYTVEAQSCELGYGAYALAVGELDAASSGKEVVAGSYGWMHVLRGTDLAVLRSLDLRTLGGWQYLDPRSLRTANLDNSHAGDEILFFTKNDRIVILNGQLQMLSSHFEPGVVDIVLGPNDLAPSYTQQPIFSSARSQLYRLGMAPGVDSPNTKLAAASQPLRELVQDIEVLGNVVYGVGWDPNTAVTDPTAHLYAWDATTLAQVGTPVNLNFKTLDVDLEVWSNSGVTYVAILHGKANQTQGLYVRRADGALPPVTRPISELAFAASALDLELYFDGQSKDPTLVLSTAGGHFVHLPVSLGNIGTADDSLTQRSTNTAATWAMVENGSNELVLVDQSSGIHVLNGGQWIYDQHPRGTDAWSPVLARPVRAASFIPPPGASLSSDLLIASQGLQSAGLFFASRALPMLTVPGLVDSDDTPVFFANVQGTSQSGTLALFQQSGATYEDKIAVGGSSFPSGHAGALMVFDSVFNNRTTLYDYSFVNTTYSNGAPGEPPLIWRTHMMLFPVFNSQHILWMRQKGEVPVILIGQRDGYVTMFSSDGQSILARSRDLGMGASALTAYDADQISGDDYVLVGTSYGYIGLNENSTGQIHCLAASDLSNVWSANVDTLGGNVRSFGISGLLVADIDGLSKGPELVVTTLDGGLYVYTFSPAGLGTMLYGRKFYGSLGCYNSIRFDSKQRVLTVAGSMGLRRFESTKL